MRRVLGDRDHVERERAARAALMQHRRRDDADEHERRAEHREQEELGGGVHAVTVAPLPDDEVHRHEHDLEADEEEEEVEREERADAAGLEQRASTPCTPSRCRARRRRTARSGTSTPVSTTRNSEMPSTPRCHEIPNDGIHSCMVTNWKPPLVRSNATSRAMLSAPVSVAATRAKSFDDLGTSRRQQGDDDHAEIAGSSTSEVRIGKSIRRSPVRRTTRGAARRRPRSRARSCARTPTAACAADGRRRGRAPPTPLTAPSITSWSTTSLVKSAPTRAGPPKNAA